MLRVFQCLTCTSNTETAYSDTYLFVAVNACFSEHQDRVKSLFRAFAKIYVSEMTSFGLMCPFGDKLYDKYERPQEG